MFEDFFFWRPLLAGICVAVCAGLLGCFVVWQRMAYFGDSIAHGALLGVALGLASGLGVGLGILLVCVSFASLLTWMQQKKVLATDTLLGVLAHVALSVGVVAVSLTEWNVDLHAYLFGDILTVTWGEIALMCVTGLAISLALMRGWSSMLLVSINMDIARAEATPLLWCRLFLMLAMAAFVAVALHLVGALLITSMLIIPAATAHRLARSPEGMAVFSVLTGSVSVILGLLASMWFDTPTGPSIIIAASLLFACMWGPALIRR